MSSSPSPSLPADVYDEVKQPIELTPLTNPSAVIVSDVPRPKPVDVFVVLSTPAADPSTVDAAVSVDPFGPPSDDWAAASSSSASTLPPSVDSSDDPFASSCESAPIVVESSIDAFAAFPKPGHVDEHSQPARSSKKKSRGKKRAQLASTSAIPSEPVSTSTLPVSSAAPSDSPAQSASAGESSEEAEGGLLMADSAAYVAMLEQRLERLKKKQEARIKAAKAKTTRRTTEFVSITTSGALNETDDEKGLLSEEKADGQQTPPQSAAVHSQAASLPSHAAASTSTPAARPSASQPAAARRHTQIGAHSAPFDEDEVQSIMSTALPSASATAAVDERGEVVEDEALMASSDGEAVGVVADKTAYYEDKRNLDEQNCCLM